MRPPLHRFADSLGRVLAVAALLAATPVGARAQDSAAVPLKAVRVTVTRDAARPLVDLPFAITRLTIDTARPALRRASLTEILLFVPGVSVSNRFNPTQDPRLSIRGFGARSAFGIRGVRVLRDGIPLTLPDGQTAVDYLDLETVGTAEVIRGSAGALYGNASGGVIDFRSEAPPAAGMRGRVHAFYSDDATRASLYGGGRIGALGVQGTVTRNEGDGPRDYSEFRNTTGFGDARWSIGGTELQTQLTLYDSPTAQNPGALTAVEMDTNRTMADPTNVRRKASKMVKQNLVSFRAARDGDRASFDLSVHGGTRDLDNPQSFAIVVFDRTTLGGSLRAQYNLTNRWGIRLGAGTDLLRQSDDRQNFSNCAGLTPRPLTCPPLATSDRGSVTLNQRERVMAVGGFVRAEVSPIERFSLTTALRSDATRFSVLDRRAASPAEEERTLHAVTPMVAANWRVRELASVYATFSSSFETPTTTELANQPNGSGGLNRELKPQHGDTYEIGAKGIWNGRVNYDASLFRVETKDELIPFEIPGGGGRRYFRNAGRTLRRGAELGVGATQGLMTLGATATWIKYTYEEFVVRDTSYEGKRVPGVAPATWGAYAMARPRWGAFTVELQRVGRTPADDRNANFADAYTLVNARAAFDFGGRLALEPTVGVDNVFDELYAANVVANATGGRFYEPGPGRTVWIGLRLRAQR